MATKKRPRADLLSSLDAAFATAKQPTASKYTAQAASQATSKDNKQQAYQHSKRKRKASKNGSQGNKGNNQSDITRNSEMKEEFIKKEKKVDPLYEKLTADLLSVGLKNCSLHGAAKELDNPRTLHKTLQDYMLSVTDGSKRSSVALDEMKYKVLTLDNPVKKSATAAAEKAIAAASRNQTSKMISARRRRELGLHLLSGEMRYSDAEKLNEIWTRYVRQLIENEINTVEPVVKNAQRERNSKLQAKLKFMDLSGCPVEVTLSQNPHNVGLHGIVVAETKYTVQICCPPSSITSTDGPIRTLMKADSRFKVRLDSTRTLVIDGEWLVARNQ